MASKNSSKALSFTDIVLNAEAAVIQQAYEARLQVEKLLAEREELYQRIAVLEEEVDQILGEPGLFPFPPPPLPVAGFSAKSTPAKRPKAAKTRKPEPAREPAEALPPAAEMPPSEDDSPAQAAPMPPSDPDRQAHP